MFAPALSDGNDGFSKEYFAKLASLEGKNFWFRSRNKLLIWALRKHFPHITSFLEIGCGTGFVLTGIHQAFPDWRLAGSEVFTQGLTFAQNRLAGVSLFQMDARLIPFDAEFDVIGAFDVLEHIDEDQTVLSQMFQAVKPGGGILVTVPQHRFLWSTLDDYSFHKRRYSRRELVDKAKRAGFTVLMVTSFVSLLLPMMLLARLRQPKNVADIDPTAELRVSPFLNRILEKVLDLERVAFRAGISFPAGGSLLLVAQKLGI